MVEAAISTLDPSSSFVDTSSLSKEEVYTLHQLMSRLETFVIAFSSFSRIGNLATLNASSTKSEDPWIIDLGASYHIIGISSLFSSYNFCFSREKVRIANSCCWFVSFIEIFFGPLGSIC